MYTENEVVQERVTPVAPVAPSAVAPGYSVPVGTVVEPVAAVPVAGVRQVARSSQQRYAVDSFIVGVVGLALTVVGLLAVTRAGMDGPMDTPVVDVIGFSHTATLGLIEAGMGLVLLICAASTSRAASIFFGLVLGVGALIGALQTDSFRRSLALESGLAWLAVIAAIVVILASFLVPRVVTRSTSYTAV
jgi:hypothetical protein